MTNEDLVLMARHISAKLTIHTAKGVMESYGVDVYVSGEDTAVFVVANIPENRGRRVAEIFNSLKDQLHETFIPELPLSCAIWVERCVDGVLIHDGMIKRGDSFDFLFCSADGHVMRSPVGDRSESAFWKLLFGAQPRGLQLTPSYADI